MKGPFCVIVKRAGSWWQVSGLYMRHPAAKRAGISRSWCAQRGDALRTAAVHLSNMRAN